MQDKLIGLLTFHDTNNFGSLLQTYGLYKKITDLGFPCEIIDYQCESIINRELPHNFSFSLSPKLLLKDLWLESAKRRKYKYLKGFLYEHMTVGDKCFKENICEYEEKYDKIIVGSDIVWGLDITKDDLTYFLDFCRNKNKKYAFSSSIGNKWNYEEQRMVAPLLQDFKYIAVREEESADWVSELTGNRPDVVSDPTMLIIPDEWLEFTNNDIKEKYVLVYFENSNGDCVRAAKELAEKEKIKVKYINYGLPKKGVSNIRPYRLEDFLSLINNAQHVVTASYHGMLFSLYFNKQFTYFNRAHKSRMNTLSARLGVSHRNGENGDIVSLPPINYKIVNMAIDAYRQHSIQCLKKMLEV